MTPIHKLRLGAAMPLAALLATSLLAGCHKDSDEATAPAPAPAATEPSGPIAATPTPGGPGGAVGATQSTKPGGAAAADAVLKAKVKSALIADSSIKASDVKVDIKKGSSDEVVLSGSLPSREEIAAAVADAKKTPGVRIVFNQLVLKK